MLGVLVAASLYTVKVGDTLSGIAGGNWPVVCQDNHIANCDLIYPGQVIKISGGGSTATVSVRDGDNDSDGRISAPSNSAPIVAQSHVQVSGGSLGCSGLEALWRSAGGNPGSAFIAAEIAIAESGGRQYATGTVGEEGYWQINPVNAGLATYNPYGNARAAIILSGNGANWSPWTTYTSGAYVGRCLWA